MKSCLFLNKTPRFTVLSVSPQKSLPVMELSDLLHQCTPATHQVLATFLKTYGYVILKLKRSSLAASIVQNMKESLSDDFFAHRQQGDVYISEKGIPMWKTGYEYCDEIREAFRVHVGATTEPPWPNQDAKKAWKRGVILCRRICDVSLQGLLGYQPTNSRPGDFSVLYAMHYFNDSSAKQFVDTNNTVINVKQHVDPSLLVLEPFLAETEGLQVFCQYHQEWITCDGPSSPIHSVLAQDETAMVLFLGKALATNVSGLTPTLHRVIASPNTRKTMIYEQKYQEFFQPPLMD